MGLRPYHRGSSKPCPTCKSHPWDWRFDEFKVGDIVWHRRGIKDEAYLGPEDMNNYLVRIAAPVPNEPGMWFVKGDVLYRVHEFMLRHRKV